LQQKQTSFTQPSGKSRTCPSENDRVCDYPIWEGWAVLTREWNHGTVLLSRQSTE